VPVPILSLLFLLVLGACIFFMGLQLFPSGEREEARVRLGISGVEAEELSPLISGLRPMYRLVSPLARPVDLPKYREWVERKFVSAGMTGAMTSDEFMGYKVVMSGAFWAFFVGLFFKALIGWDEPIAVDILVLVIGFFYPDIWITGEVQRRQHAIRRSLPYVMDLLTLSVEAGLDFVAGVNKVCEKARSGPLIDELAFFLSEIQVGASRQQALRNLAWRVDMPEMRSFSALLIQADILGASVGPVLRAQSDLIRTQRFQRAERMGAYAAQKILFPLILCIMPAVFIMIFGPIALNFIYGSGVVGS
jgi:tight adherence protein C